MNRRGFIKSIGIGLLVGNSELMANSFYKQKDEFMKNYTMLERCPSKKTLEQVIKPKKDIVYTGDKYRVLKRTFYRLKRIQRTIGYGHFNIINYEDALKVAKRYSKVGAFTKEEVDFLEELFYANAANYGFFGEKVLDKITDKISKRDTRKIPYTGHYLYRGRSEAVYAKVKKDLGNRVILTSGVRGVVKQMYLFLNKAIKENGNLSVASRSLAPPGYSFHGVGDFDVGKVGFGYRNFTSDFAHTEEYRKLMDLGYIRIRYPQGNPYGVRFEPWHVKVV